MKDLLFFKNLYILVDLLYDPYSKVLTYSTSDDLYGDRHNDRIVIEDYIRKLMITRLNLAPSQYIMSYAGLSLELQKKVNSTKFLGWDKEEEKWEWEENSGDIDIEISKLLESSMKNYYFEKIGDTILEIRSGAEKVEELKELITAYNIYSEKKINFEDLNIS